MIPNSVRSAGEGPFPSACFPRDPILGWNPSMDLRRWVADSAAAFDSVEACAQRPLDAQQSPLQQKYVA